MLAKIYSWLHNLSSRPEERGEYSSGHWQDMARQETLDLCRYTKGRVLEVGCGEGLFIENLVKKSPNLEVYGVDNDEERLNAARARLIGVNLSKQDAAGLSFEDGYFDAVICVNVLFNMRTKDDVRRALTEMKRVCKTGGSIIFDIRNSANPIIIAKYALAKYYDDTLKGLPLKTYSVKEIEDVLKSLSMKIVDKKYIGLKSRIFSFVIVMEAKRC